MPSVKNALLATIAARNHRLLAMRETSSRHPRLEAHRGSLPRPAPRRSGARSSTVAGSLVIACIGASAGSATCLPRGRRRARPVRVRRRGVTSRERRLHSRVHTRVYGQMGQASRESDLARRHPRRLGVSIPWRASLRTSRGSGSRRPARDAAPRDAAASDAVASLERRAGTPPRMKRRPRTKRWRVRRRRSRARLIEFGVGTSASSAR